MIQKITNVFLQKPQLLSKWILMLALFAMTGAGTANAQCNWNTGALYGTGTAGTSCLPTTTGTQQCHYFSEYATFNGLTVGQTYTITTTNTTTTAGGPFTLGVYTAITSGTTPLASTTNATFPISVTFVATTTTIYTKNFKSGCVSSGNECNYFTMQCNSCASTAGTNQPSTSSAAIGAPGIQVLRVDVPACSAGDVTSLTFTTAGSTNAADISNAKVYYTSSTTFSSSSQFGSAVANPNGSFTVVGTQSLTSGSTGYFWLTYDVACNATLTDVLDAGLTTYTFAGTPSVPATPNPTGTRDIVAASAPPYTATTTTSTTVGTANVTMGRINITGDNCNTAVTSVKFNTAGSPVTDISLAKCYYTTSTTFNTDSLFGTAVLNPNGDITFNGSKALALGTGNNFWLTYDISCSAGTVVGVDSVVGAPVSITTNVGLLNVATPSTNAKKKVNAQVAPTYTSTTTTSAAVGNTNITLGRINIAGDNCNTSVTSVKFNTAGSTIADISRARCYYTTGTTFNTDSLFGTPVLNPNGDITFNGSKALAAGTGNNFWLTYDISCNAGTVVGVDSVIATPVSITTNISAISVAAPSTNIKKGIITATTYNTAADGDWSSPATWACGNIPTSSSNVNINNAVTVSTSGNVASNVTVNTGASLIISSGDLTMGAAGGDKKVFTSSGILTVSGGTLNLNGNMVINSGSTFNQSGGNINVDGNAAGVTANSVASGTYLVSISTQNVNWTGGTFTIVDPHAASGTNYAFYYSNSTANIEVPATHTMAFGNGVSSDAGGSTNGFYVNNYVGSNKLNFGNITINGTAANNRFVTTVYSTAIHGNLLITNGGEFRTSGIVHLNGNLTVTENSYFTCTSTLGLYYYTGTSTIAPSTNAQVISGSGIFRNAATSPTANFASLTVNNTNATGVTFADANSLLSGTNTGTVSGTLTMTAGKINVGSNTFVLGISASSTGTYTYSAGVIIGGFKRWLGSSTGARAFDIGMGNVGRKVSIDFTTAPTTGGSLTAKWNSGAPGSAGLPLTEGGNTYTNTSANGYWTVSTGDGLAGGTYTVAMTLTGGSDAPDYSTVTIGKRSTSADPWALVGTAVAATGSATNFTVSRTGVTGFSDFVLLLTSTPLSVKLSSFTGRNAGAVNILNWTTANEKDASHFDIMRSNDGSKFEKLTTVNAQNVSTGSKYEFTDVKPFEGRNFYRLNMVDANGKSVLSDVVILSVKSSAGLSLVASPNPVNQTLNVSVNGKIDGKATIQVIDITGKIIQKIQVSSNDTNIDMSALSNGTYIIKYNDNSNSSVIKVTKN
ncbi:T9SS type A sorting domain-containing protein [Taibaiella lutea]|uniref:T9SS type A sorting domain-containing protein n=1 Tax=Taibaiella lutea TaxID=2608001 RepID=A0A5M6CQW7_9BACT|nr:T9SS type A sorting domain-containing protein [Taibaiella lutea]KAA5537353.1 T9SS type A sorting domain-containing protein [Taibaiella lutea]